MAINATLKPWTRANTKGTRTLVQNFSYFCEKTKVKIFIDKGFVFDGASINRAFWTTTGSPFSPANEGPGLVHDYLYRTAKDLYGIRLSRKTCDKVFEHALRKNEKSIYNRIKMYRAVRSFGFIAWNKHRKNDI